MSDVETIREALQLGMTWDGAPHTDLYEPALFALDRLEARVEYQSDLSRRQGDRIRAAEARVEALEGALREAHEELCGCDQPGRIAYCITSGSFDVLATDAGCDTHPITPEEWKGVK